MYRYSPKVLLINKSRLAFIIICSFMASYVFSHSSFAIKYPNISLVTTGLNMIGYVFSILSVLMNKAIFRNKKIWIYIILSFLCALISKNVLPLRNFLLVVALIEVKKEKLLGIYILSLFVFVIFILISLSTGLIFDRYTYSIKGIAKYSLGFSHPNILGLIIILLLFTYLVRARKNFRHILISCALALLVTLITCKSRSTILGILIFISLCFIQRKFVIKTNCMKFGLYTIVFVILTLSVILPIIYQPSINAFSIIDKALTGRIALTQESIMVNGVSLFGKPIEIITAQQAHEQGLRTNAIDNAYMYMLVRYGIVYAALFCYAFIRAIYINLSSRSLGTKLLLFSAISLFVVGFVENQILDFRINIIFLIFLQSFFLYGNLNPKCKNY